MQLVRSIVLSSGLVFVFSVPSHSQDRRAQEKCEGPVYKVSEVSQRAKILEYADTSVLVKAATQYNFHGTIKVDAVLCRNGHVTDIEIKQTLPTNLDGFVIDAISLVKFKPAELNWHSVSQYIQYELSLNDDSPVEQISGAQAAGRLVEDLDVMGNRRMTREEIMDLIKTRPGDPYNAAQVEADLAALLMSGNFNKSGTRVMLEDGVRGGVRVLFQVFELPLISEISFGRAGWGRQSELSNEFARHRVDLRDGKPFDLAELRKATKVIEDYYRSQGWLNVKAEASVESLTFEKVRIAFKITGTNF
jgi:Surface antigen variable number repeat/Gram-negative bacterial TonB protein C-terminal